ncbi:hypothetical protein DSL72_007297 [Monilinia vaccinii-corymbosi]|uniref:Uncharacterized protein n=1 Tax=Monilinia vaccinii-corymbosi TaxID=61207 RepID=A0A8A3PL88_9HELO|nr:hypothetical protein DSL72_007297 [Monilinia vaccinii-corymbosi]
MKFFAIFAAAIALASVTAAPTISSGLEEFGAKTVFYTGTTTTNQNAKDYAAAIDGKYCGFVYPTKQMLNWLEECGVSVEQNKLIPRMAQALAQATTGQAYLLLRRGEVLAPDSVWMQDEWPALQDRVPITAVNTLEASDTLANWTPNNHIEHNFEFDDGSD